MNQNTNGRSSAIDGRTTRHDGYAISLRCRARIEEIYGWLKTAGGQRQTVVHRFEYKSGLRPRCPLLIEFLERLQIRARRCTVAMAVDERGLLRNACILVKEDPMNKSNTNAISGLDQLLLDSTLAGLDEEASAS